MFNLDLELDFDDDFPTNLFAKQLDNPPETSTQQIKNTNHSNLKPVEEFKTDTSWERLNSNEVQNKIFTKTSSQQIKNTNHSNLKPVEESKSDTSWERLNNNEVQNKKVTDLSSNSFFNFPLESSHVPSSFKRSRPEDDRPQKKKISHENLLQRKFPGPAGLLPDKPFREIKDISHPVNKFPSEEDEECKNEPVIYSQSSGSVFLESAYQKLVIDFELNKANNPLNKYKVEWVKKAAMNKALHGRKIPFLAVVLHSIDQSMPDPVLLLRDPTGEINGTLHREVWLDMGGKLKTGIGLALRQVGVMMTGVIRRQIYLNITINNILAVYNPSENDSDVEITTINKLSKSELYKSVERWQAQIPAPQSPAKTQNHGLFTTVESPRTSDDEIQNLRNKLQNFVNRNQGNPPETAAKETRKQAEEVVAGFLDFAEDMTPKDAEDTGASSQVLSRAESLIFEEVLSGINLDEFEM